MLGIEHPVVQAGMAGGPTTPRLVAAVSEAGGLGTLGAAYMAPAAIRAAVGEIRALTQKPFAVNLFVPEPFDPSLYDPEEIGASLAAYREELGIEAPGELSYAQSFEEQLAVLLEEGVPVFSFTFGIPGEGEIGALREAGVVTIGTATTVREAMAVEAAGIDAVTAQGAEAGGHRGTFLGPYEGGLVGTMALVPQVVDAVGIPVLAAGGIMDGRGLAAALALGADGVQMGTAFLACPESGAHEGYKRALLGATEEETTVTRAFSGKAARGIKNRFTEEMEGVAVAGYPVQNAHTRDVRVAAAKSDRTEFMSLWSGQAPRLARPVPAAEVVERTVAVASGWREGKDEGSGASMEETRGFATADLCDEFGEEARVAEPVFRDYGGVQFFGGPISTVRVFEDNVLVREALEEDGRGRVLVVDGGGSTRCALVGGNLAALAHENGWAGMVVYGCVRDSVEISAVPIGVRALYTSPRKSAKEGAGDRDSVVSFAGVDLGPGRYLYADEDGIVVADHDLRQA